MAQGRYFKAIATYLTIRSMGLLKYMVKIHVYARDLSVMLRVCCFCYLNLVLGLCLTQRPAVQLL